MKPSPLLWTDDEIIRLGEMIDDHFSMSQCARALGRTRSMVAGQARRRGWHFGQPRTAEQRAAPLRKPPRRPPPRQRMAPEDRPRMFSVCFDPDTFAEIKGLAEREGVSLNRKVRELVEWGLQA